MGGLLKREGVYKFLAPNRGSGARVVPPLIAHLHNNHVIGSFKPGLYLK